MTATKQAYATTLETGQRDAQVMLSVDAYNYGFFLGLVFFGVHLLLLGFVMVNLARVVLPDYRDYEGLLLLLLVVLGLPGEFGLVGWLLWRGAKPGPLTSSPAVDRDVHGCQAACRR